MGMIARRRARRAAAVGTTIAAAANDRWTEATWCVDAIADVGGSLVVTGWAVAREGNGSDRLEILVDGRRVKRATMRLPRPDIGELFWDRVDSARAGFEVTIEPTRGAIVSPTNPLRLSLSVDGATRTELDYFYPGEQQPIPPVGNRRRVHGGDDLAGFLLEGFSSFTKLGDMLERVTGIGYEGYDTILDWGVGCGRFARYLGHGGATGQRIIGVDIDETNIDWCVANVPVVDARLISATPPTLIPDESIDLVIGIGVFTHLGEYDQRLWLRELHRITRPGAILALTTHGRATFARSRLGAEWFEVWQREGFMDGGVNADIDGAVPSDPAYYRNVFTTQAYVRSVWGEFFDIVDVHEGLIGNHQDLNILRRVAEPRPPRAISEPPARAAPASDESRPTILDAYVRSAPSAQNAVDLFAGSWTSSLPSNLGLRAGETETFDDGRITAVIDHLGGIANFEVLELGPMEGGHSYMLHEAGADVTAIEGSSQAFLKCLVVKEILGLAGCHFLLGDFLPYLATTDERFDLVLASGVLYHATDPIALLEAISRVTDRVAVWTHYWDADSVAAISRISRTFVEAPIEVEWRNHLLRVHPRHYLEALAKSSFCGGPEPSARWMERDGLMTVLREIGFTDISVLGEDIRHVNGPSILLVAQR